MFKHMEDSVPPEIMRTNLSSFLLTLKALDIHNILSFDLMMMSTAIALCHGLELLYSLRVINDETNVTGIGNKIAEFPTEPRVSRMLVELISQGCMEEVLCVASTLQSIIYIYSHNNHFLPNVNSVLYLLYPVDNTSEHVIFGQTYDGSRGGIEVRFYSAIGGKWLLEIAPYYWA